jgi:uncharacterized protein
MRFRPVALAVLCLLATGPTLRADTLPARTEGHVRDLAEVLDAGEEARIEGILTETEAQTGVEMVVVTLTDPAAHGGDGERMDAYARRLLQAWEIGSPERGDGILILLATGSAEARIALGSGYAPVYDERAARVLRESVLPALREGNAAEGIEAGVIAARDRLIAPFLTGAPVTAGEGFESTGSGLPPLAPYLLLVVAVLAVMVYRSLRSARLQKTCPRCGDRTLTRTFEVIEPPARGSEGSGIEHRLCKGCGHTDRQMYSLKPSFVGGYRRKLDK